MPNIMYNKNCFFIEDREGNFTDSFINPINDNAYNAYDLLSYLDNDFDSEKLDAAISLQHELNHYIQDMSINACIVRGHLNDLLASMSIELSKCKDVRFPLFDHQNHVHNHSVKLDSKYAGILKTIDELYEIRDFVFGKHTKPDTKDYKFNSTNEDLFNNNEISVDYFLETYAYHKAYWDAFKHFEDKEEADKLHELVKQKKVYPVYCRDNSFYVDDYLFDIRMRKQYQLLNMLLMFSVDYDVKKYVDYCDKDIPKKYTDSLASFTHSIHQLIFEAALYIPSLDHILTEVYCNKKNKEQFSPSHRFYLIIKAIRDYKLPEPKDGEDYFKIFYNWLAEKYGWLSYDDTYKSIATYLYERCNNYKEVIIHYQSMLTYHKYTDFKRFYQTQSDDIMRIFSLPLAIMSKNGLIFYHYYGTLIVCPTGLINVYDSFFGIINRYEYHSNIESSQLKTIMDNQRGAFREIICRLFSIQVREKHLTRGVYRCPFSEHICPRASEKCRSFETFKEVFTNCKKNIFRGDNGNYLCDEHYGNTFDCMFYNYLLDIKYNINYSEVI